MWGLQQLIAAQAAQLSNATAVCKKGACTAPHTSEFSTLYVQLTAALQALELGKAKGAAGAQRAQQAAEQRAAAAEAAAEAAHLKAIQMQVRAIQMQVRARFFGDSNPGGLTSLTAEASVAACVASHNLVRVGQGLPVMSANGFYLSREHGAPPCLTFQQLC